MLKEKWLTLLCYYTMLLTLVKSLQLKQMYNYKFTLYNTKDILWHLLTEVENAAL